MPRAERLAAALPIALLALSSPPPARTQEGGGAGALGSVSYGPSGLVVQSEDGNYRLQVRLRLEVVKTVLKILG